MGRLNAVGCIARPRANGADGSEQAGMLVGGLILFGVGVLFLIVGIRGFGSGTYFCTVCQKPVQPIGGGFSQRRCPMCRNTGSLQRL